MQKNVMTKLSEMLVKGEANEGSTISVDAMDDKRGLKYVVKKAADPRGKRPVMELPSDSNDSDDVVEVTPITKKMKVVSIAAAADK